MSEHPTWLVGNRNPSVTETITAGGVAVDLSSSTVRFKMRAVGSDTLAVDQEAVIVEAAAGAVRYDWAAADVDTAGMFLVWWEVTTAGKTQDVGEAVIEIRAHAPGLHVYVELEELKSTLQLSGQSYADLDIQQAILAASRAVDELTHRRFWPDEDANQVRYYTPNGLPTVGIDDLLDLTTLDQDYDGDGTFEQTLTENTDFLLEPLNAAADGRPWDALRLHPSSAYLWSSYPRSLKVTGQFGWAAAPAGVKVASSQIATRLLKIMREAPFGVVAFGLENAIRVSRTMPEVELALAPYVKPQILA